MNNDAMSWSCGACTYLNTAESLNKCAICETARSNGAPEGSTNENGSKKRSKELKSTVQATLFGGIATTVNSRKDKKPKRSVDTGVDAKPKRSLVFTQPVTTFASNTTNRFEIWKQTAKDDVPFSKLEERTRTAMKQIFNVVKLRLLQPKAVKCALKRKSQIVVMATGGGMFTSSSIQNTIHAPWSIHHPKLIVILKSIKENPCVINFPQ